MEYKQAKTLQMRIYNMASIKLWILGNRDPATMMLCVSGVSGEDTTLFSVTSSHDASYAWVGNIVKTNVSIHISTARLPTHAESTWTTPASITPAICKVFSIITLPD
jgi:hypothetical protein